MDKPGEALKLLGAASADEGKAQPSLPVTRKPIVKSPPAGLPADLQQFLVKKPMAMTVMSTMTLPRRQWTRLEIFPGIPEKKKAILKARRREPSKSRARSRGRTLEPEGGAQRSRSRGDEKKTNGGSCPAGTLPGPQCIRKEQWS